MELKLIPSDLLTEFLSVVPKGMKEAFFGLQDAPLSTANFSFYTSVASVYSSKIEGEAIELDSYIKHKREGITFQPDYTQKIDDLYSAYLYAQAHPLTKENIKAAHRLLSRNLVAETWQGKFRSQNMYVANEEGKIEYVAALPSLVPGEMEAFFQDVIVLLEKEMTVEEVFFFASLLHLVFVKIHPWTDGNGRTARLIEKWFLAEKLGEKAWFLQSEKMYYQRHSAYYQNLRQLGLEYDRLDYSKAISFVLMLPTSLPDTSV